MSQSPNQRTLLDDFWIDPSRIEEFKELHRPAWAARAKEPQCFLFDIVHDPAEQGRFRSVEVWSESREWFEKYQSTKDYYTPLWEKSRPIWLQEAMTTYFEREDEGYKKQTSTVDSAWTDPPAGHLVEINLEM